MTPFFSVCFGAPTEISNITSDPLNTKVQQWWDEKAKEIYDLWPGFGGFLVKADSEGNTFYSFYTPFIRLITIYAPVYTRYIYVYTPYIPPNTPLNTHLTPYLHR
jgi:hypothetical protein